MCVAQFPPDYNATPLCRHLDLTTLPPSSPLIMKLQVAMGLGMSLIVIDATEEGTLAAANKRLKEYNPVEVSDGASGKSGGVAGAPKRKGEETLGGKGGAGGKKGKK